MATYARKVDDVAVELFVEFGGFSIDECFHPDLRKQFVLVPDDTIVNSTWDGSKWVPPIIPDEAKNAENQSDR